MLLKIVALETEVKASPAFTVQLAPNQIRQNQSAKCAVSRVVSGRDELAGECRSRDGDRGPSPSSPSGTTK